MFNFAVCKVFKRLKDMKIFKNKTNKSSVSQEGLPFQTGSRNSYMKTVCCVCEKIKNGNSWIKSKRYHNKVLTHGYCPECFQEVLNEWGLEYI